MKISNRHPQTYLKLTTYIFKETIFIYLYNPETKLICGTFIWPSVALPLGQVWHCLVMDLSLRLSIF